MDRFRSLLERRSLVAKLVAGLAVLILLTILLRGFNAILVARDMGRQAAELHQRELLGIIHIKEANIDLISTGRALLQMVLAPTFVDRDEARVRLDTAMLGLEEELAAARKRIFSAQERLLLNEFELEFEQYRRNVNDAVTLIDGSTDYQGKATAYISGEQFNQIAGSADQLLHRMAAIKEEGARETVAAMARHGRDAQWLTLGLLLGGLLFGTVLMVLIGRFAKQPADRSHAIDNPAGGSADDAMPATSYRNEPVAKEQSVAMKVEPVQTEACGLVENMPKGMLVVDEQGAVISPGHTAEICGEECARERFGFLGGPHIAPLRRVSILVVEDGESNQEATGGLLANSGCQVTIAYSGQEALALLEKSAYDVVLMNMQMVKEGINATLEIRKNPAFDRLSVIAMTTSGIHHDRARCLAAGINGHITQPIDPDELLRALMRWISDETRYAHDDAIIASVSRPLGGSLITMH